MPFYFAKYEFTKFEQEEIDRAATKGHENPLETEISDEYMTFTSNNNLNISFGSEKI